jgi:hypothetical protein
MDAREAAKHLIQKYVERGDSVESLRASHMGASAPHSYYVSIGGYMPVGGKPWATDWILVYRDMNGKEVNIAFKLQEIYNECKTGQTRLF